MASYNELKELEGSIKSFINKENKLSTKLKFKLRKNLKVIEESLGIIEEDFASFSEDNQERYNEFQRKRMQLIKEHDGDIRQVADGQLEVTNWQQLQTDKEFVKKLEELDKEYNGLFEIMKNNQKRNAEIARKDVVNPEYIMIDIEEFPEYLDGDFPEAFLEFVGHN